jgi:hypothetical protein
MTTFLNIKDNAQGTLLTAITDVTTPIVMHAGDGAKFPATNFVVTIDSEKILVTARTGDELTTITRGYDSTAASTHSADAAVKLNVIAKHIDDITGAVTTLEGEMNTAQGDITTNAGDLSDHASDSEDPHGETLTQTGIISETVAANTRVTTPEIVVNDIVENTAAHGVEIDGVLLKDSQVTTDVINEKTAAAGVTVDTMWIKDGGIVSDKPTTTSVATSGGYPSFSEKWVRLSNGAGTTTQNLLTFAGDNTTVQGISILVEEIAVTGAIAEGRFYKALFNSTLSSGTWSNTSNANQELLNGTVTAATYGYTTVGNTRTLYVTINEAYSGALIKITFVARYRSGTAFAITWDI